MLSVRDGREQYRRHRRAARGAALVSLSLGALAALASVILFAGAPALALAGAGLGAGAATAMIAVAGAGLFRRADGSPLSSPGPANTLTLLRFVLIGPMCVLLLSGSYAESLAVYALLAFTDVADGVVARIRRETSDFGVVMDPLADVFSTFALFSVFVVDNIVPLWLYLLLAARYAMLLVGSLVLSAAVGPIVYRATIPGKVVGVVQAAGAGVLIWTRRTGGAGASVETALFALLGLGFAWVIVSQGVIGWRHIRRATTGG